MASTQGKDLYHYFCTNVFFWTYVYKCLRIKCFWLWTPNFYFNGSTGSCPLTFLAPYKYVIFEMASRHFFTWTVCGCILLRVFVVRLPFYSTCVFLSTAYCCNCTSRSQPPWLETTIFSLFSNGPRPQTSLLTFLVSSWNTPLQGTELTVPPMRQHV